VALPDALLATVRRIEAHRGWGDALVVEVRTGSRRRVEEFRHEILAAIAATTGEARIMLRILDH